MIVSSLYEAACLFAMPCVGCLAKTESFSYLLVHSYHTAQGQPQEGCRAALLPSIWRLQTRSSLVACQLRGVFCEFHILVSNS